MHPFAPRLALGTFCMVVLAACSPGSQVPDGPSGAPLEVRQAEFNSALEALDARRLAALFAEDGEVHVAGFEAVEGREAIAAFYERVFGFMVGSRITPGPLRASESGDMAYGTGATANEFRGPDGPTAHHGKYLVVWRRLDGDWRIGAYSLTGDNGGGGP